MVAKRGNEAKYPCLRCRQPITPSRATYLFSISHSRNVGPFHSRCAAMLTVEEEDHLWSNAATLLAAAVTYGPTHRRDSIGN